MANDNTSLQWIRGAEIGRGIHGTVFLAMAVLNGSLMAAKTVENSVANSKVKILRREASLLRNLANPSIIQYLDFEEKPESLTLFLDYIPGGSVSDLLSNYGAFEDSLARNFIQGILGGLSYLHDRSIIHGNLNASNILVANDGSIRIAGFSLARNFSQDAHELDERTWDSIVFYTAPEVVATQTASMKGDVWSLGTIVVEMTTKKRVWADLDAHAVREELAKLAHPPLSPEIELSPSADFVNACFAIAPDRRPTAQDLVNHPWLSGPKSSIA